MRDYECTKAHVPLTNANVKDVQWGCWCHITLFPVDCTRFSDRLVLLLKYMLQYDIYSAQSIF